MQPRRQTLLNISLALVAACGGTKSPAPVAPDATAPVEAAPEARSLEPVFVGGCPTLDGCRDLVSSFGADEEVTQGLFADAKGDAPLSVVVFSDGQDSHWAFGFQVEGSASTGFEDNDRFAPLGEGTFQNVATQHYVVVRDHRVWVSENEAAAALALETGMKAPAGSDGALALGTVDMTAASVPQRGEWIGKFKQGITRDLLESSDTIELFVAKAEDDARLELGIRFEPRPDSVPAQQHQLVPQVDTRLTTLVSPDSPGYVHVLLPMWNRGSERQLGPKLEDLRAELDEAAAGSPQFENFGDAMIDLVTECDGTRDAEFVASLEDRDGPMVVAALRGIPAESWTRLSDALVELSRSELAKAEEFPEIEEHRPKRGPISYFTEIPGTAVEKVFGGSPAVAWASVDDTIIVVAGNSKQTKKRLRKLTTRARKLPTTHGSQHLTAHVDVPELVSAFKASSFGTSALLAMLPPQASNVDMTGEVDGSHVTYRFSVSPPLAKHLVDLFKG